MTFWTLFPAVVVVFGIFFYIAQFKLDDRYRGLKVAVWAYPFAISGALAFALGYHRVGVVLFLMGLPFVAVGAYLHICSTLKINPRFRRPPNWDDD